MGFIKQLFQRTTPTPAAYFSPLAELLATMSPDRARDILLRQANVAADERYAEPISILVLHTANNNAEYLHLQWRKNIGRKSELPEFRYDEIVAEFAAFAHFWLLRDYLNYEHRNYSADQEPFYLALHSALNASGRILARYLPSLQGGHFQTKTMSYGMPTLMEKDAVLMRLIIRAQLKNRNDIELPYLENAATKTSHRFHEKELPELEKTIWGLYQSSLSPKTNNAIEIF